MTNKEHSPMFRRHLLELSVKELPGVGWKLGGRLADLNIDSVRDLRSSGRDLLRRELGDKSGDVLWKSAHGQDERAVETIRARKCVAGMSSQDVSVLVRVETTGCILFGER